MGTTLRKQPTMEGLTLIRYLGRDLGTTWQAFSKRSYTVTADAPVFGVLPVDVNWFLTKYERGKQLFILEPVAIEEVVANPVVEAEPVIEFSVIEETPTVESEPLEIDTTELEAKPKRTRKPKTE